MELSERMMVSRYELGNAQEDAALRSHGGLGMGILTLALAAIAALLVAATIEAYQGWAHLVVIGGLFVTVVGLMIAIAPNRRG
jgi:hypothetical protein